MNQHTDDIAELEGPFEQIAGIGESDGSSGSSDEGTITLTLSKSIVDYGEIKLAKITNISGLYTLQTTKNV